MNNKSLTCWNRSRSRFDRFKKDFVLSSTDQTTRFGIIGTGRITRRLVADLQSTDNVSVTAIASRTDERARWYADQYGVANAVTGYQQLIQRDDVDAVYISLPPSMHAEWSIAAADAGKHVLCENRWP